MQQTLDPQLIQEQQYEFPYHFTPQIEDDVWKIYRYLVWGYEYLAILEAIAQLTLSYNPEKVLDFGCGDGRLISELSHKGIPDIVGVDTSELATAFAKAVTGNKSPIRFFNSLEELESEKFNAVIAMEVLEHLNPAELTLVLKQIYNVLDDLGVILISVPTQNRPLNKKHYQHFTRNSLTKEINGLFIIESYFFVHKVSWFANILRRLVVNQFFIPTWEPWLKFTTFLYKRYIMNARESNGAHLIAVLRKDSNAL